MIDFPLLQYKPTITSVDIDAVSTYLNSGGFITEYKYSRQFESCLAGITGHKHSHLFPNGTLTLYAAICSLDIPVGSKVVVPNYTMAASAFAPIAANYDVVFCDVEFPSLCLDFDSIVDTLERYNDISAVILVSANGRYPSYPVADLRHLLDQKNIFLVEDAAQSLGSLCPFTRDHVGAHGIATSFSFSMPKIITTGQGGIVVTNNASISDKLSSFRDFGRSAGGTDIHDSFGLNFKFTDLQAVLGLSQLSQLNERISAKKQAFSFLSSNVNSKYLSFLPNDLNFTTPWFFEIVSDCRVQLIDHLSSLQILTRKMYPELNKQVCFSDHFQHDTIFPVSSYIANCGLWLPSYSHLTKEELCYIVDALNSFVPA